MIDEQKGPSVLLAMSMGFLAGAVTALMLAPASGEETRRKVTEVAGRVGDKAREGLDTVKDFASRGRDRVEYAINEGKQTYMSQTRSVPTAGTTSTTPRT